MKKLAFIYDHRFYLFNGRYYSEGAFNSKSWNRYLEAFEEVVVFSSIYEANYEKVERLNDVTNPKVSFVHFDYINSPIEYIKSVLFLDKKAFKKLEGFDYIAIRLPGLLSNKFFKLALKSNKKIATEVVGCIWDSYSNYGTLTAKILAPIEYIRMRRFVSKSNAVIYVTSSFLQKRYPTKAFTSNASNVQIRASSAEVLSKRKIKNLEITNKNTIVIGISGSFNVKYKGHLELLKSLEILKLNTDLNFKIEMIGPGDPTWILNEAEKRNLKSNLNIKGKLKAGEEVINWLDSINIYVHPSKQEGLPRSVIEAMSRGCLVLASSVAGTPELLSNEFLHQPGDFKKLSNQIKQILSQNLTELNKISAQNYETSKKYDELFLDSVRVDFWNRFSKM